MKTKIILTALLLLTAIAITEGGDPKIESGDWHVQGPSSSDRLIEAVLLHNRSLMAANEQFQASVLEAGTGIFPSDPRIEFGYLYGNPSLEGNRIDFSVTQQIDFPTSIIHKSRLRETKSGAAELKFLLTRQEVLLQARRLWIERIYLNISEKMIQKRLKEAEILLDQYREMLQAGETGQLEFSQANLQWVALRSEYGNVQSELRSNRIAVEEVTGGFAIEITDTIFPPSASILADSLMKDYSQGPEQQLYDRIMILKEQEQKLAVSESLPKLSGGYYSETLADQKFKGFQVGFTVPLWENANRVKQAKREIMFAEADAQRFTGLQAKSILQKLDELENLSGQIEDLENALGRVNDGSLLYRALDLGEISLSEYLYNSEIFFRNAQMLNALKRDRLLVEADLQKIYF